MQPVHVGRADLVGEPCVLVDVGHRRRLDRRAGQRRGSGVRKVRAVGIAGPVPDEDAQTEATPAGLRQALHITAVDAHVGAVRALDPGLRLVGARSEGRLDRAPADRLELV